ncbi:hypothetical protein [Novosphingobium sp. ZW T3_23]|uniref:hypothetical protein n=1 Tax=Novosphingobium sp. ZW T3_23 TaxID=3378084 RepID=UPI003852FF40
MSTKIASVPAFVRPVVVGILALAAMSQVATINADLLAGQRNERTTEPAALRGRLAQSLYDQVALRRLASAEALRGNDAPAQALISLAGRLGWRDSPTGLMLLDDAVRRGDASAAMRHIDALLRRKPELAPRLMPALHAAATDTIGRNALIERLDTSPPWRKEFFTRFDFIAAPSRNAHEALLIALAEAGKPARPDEITPYVGALAQEGEIAQAHKLWITVNKNAGAGPVLDPQFGRFEPGRSAPVPNPFEWTAHRLPGIALKVAADADKPSARNLVIATDGTAHGTVLTQTLVLGPGRYRLFVKMPSASVLAAGGLKWMVRCLPGSRTVSTQGSAASAGWQADFAIPPSGCSAQLLSLQARRADGHAAGEARLEKVQAVPLAGNEGPLT